MKIILIFISLFFSNIRQVDAQKFYLGEPIEINSNEFKLVGISSKTGVFNYRYNKPISDKMFEREIGDIIVGVKDGRVASTIYNLIPHPNDVGVPS